MEEINHSINMMSVEKRIKLFSSICLSGKLKQSTFKHLTLYDRNIVKSPIYGFNYCLIISDTNSHLFYGWCMNIDKGGQISYVDNGLKLLKLNPLLANGEKVGFYFSH